MTNPALIADVNEAIEVYEKQTGQYASRTRQMITQYGHVTALARLVESSELQRGFKILRDRDLLELTFEAVVVKHAIEFAPETVKCAQYRLEHADKL